MLANYNGDFSTKDTGSRFLHKQMMFSQTMQENYPMLSVNCFSVSTCNVGVKEGAQGVTRQQYCLVGVCERGDRYKEPKGVESLVAMMDGVGGSDNVHCLY